MFSISYFFFFNDTATTEIYTLSLHDALPIYDRRRRRHRKGLAHRVAGRPVRDARLTRHPGSGRDARSGGGIAVPGRGRRRRDRKSTRLNSSHANISYAVFCLKKKKKKLIHYI